MTETEPKTPTPEQPRKISLSLLENAYDSLNASLERAELSVVDSRAWKLAIFLLVHALELLMKERLRRDHRLLVFTNVDKPSHTVSMEVALSRLQAVGVAIEAADASAIRQAIEWRDKIAHYEFELVTDELERTYALLFEFAHSFHERQLGAELHPHISPENWATEAQLMEVFRSQFITYNGVPVIPSWPKEIVTAQGVRTVEIEGQAYERIAYGGETRWQQDGDSSYALIPCHDCAAVKGQLHVPGCDVESCPRCGGQFITCECSIRSPDDEGAEESGDDA
jgi:hypothetical protein